VLWHRITAAAAQKLRQKRVSSVAPRAQLTQQVKRGAVKRLAVNGGFVDLPVTRVHNGAVRAVSVCDVYMTCDV
jgi:hypothetical protein